MKTIEQGKQFEDVLTVEELDKVTGGMFCIRVKWCFAPEEKEQKQKACGIVICSSF